MLVSFMAFLQEFLTFREQDNRPGWAARRTKSRGRAKPFQSTRKREPGPQNMKVETFHGKEQRNWRWQELREAGHTQAVRWSTVRHNYSVWCVAY